MENLNEANTHKCNGPRQSSYRFLVISVQQRLPRIAVIGFEILLEELANDHTGLLVPDHLLHNRGKSCTLAALVFVAVESDGLGQLLVIEFLQLGEDFPNNLLVGGAQLVYQRVSCELQLNQREPLHLLQASCVVHLVVGEMENSKIRNLRLEDGEEVETGAVQLVVGKIQCCHLRYLNI